MRERASAAVGEVCWSENLFENARISVLHEAFMQQQRGSLFGRRCFEVWYYCRQLQRCGKDRQADSFLQTTGREKQQIAEKINTGETCSQDQLKLEAVDSMMNGIAAEAKSSCERA